MAVFGLKFILTIIYTLDWSEASAVSRLESHLHGGCSTIFLILIFTLMAKSFDLPTSASPVISPSLIYSVIPSWNFQHFQFQLNLISWRGSTKSPKFESVNGKLKLKFAHKPLRPWTKTTASKIQDGVDVDVLRNPGLVVILEPKALVGFLIPSFAYSAEKLKITHFQENF